MNGDIQSTIDEIRRARYTDSGDFREMCREYAAKNGMTVEEATAILKSICDNRETRNV